MKFLNSIKDINNNDVSVVGHNHSKSEITDMPTKLSQFQNDTGFTSNALQQTIGTTQPATRITGQVWIQTL